jgi:hypothetical protein
MSPHVVATVVLLAAAGYSVADSKPLAIAPRDGFAILAELKAITGQDLEPTADESALFAEAAKGKLDQFTLDEAALIACGVADRPNAKTISRDSTPSKPRRKWRWPTPGRRATGANAC